MTATAPAPAAPVRSPVRSAAIPAEHGGWGLTLEPVLLGLLVAPSAAGAALGAAALVAFVARTPVKLVLVDRWRGRRLRRTVVAERVAVTELVVLTGLVAVATVVASAAFWVPLALAAPLVALELWFDMRSRSRRLVPELAGTIGVGSVAAAIVLADGDAARLAAGLWMIAAARAVASLPFVRLQLARAKRRAHGVLASDSAQATAVVVAGGAVALDHRLLAGLVAVVLVAGFHVAAARRDPPAAAVLGAQQTVLGLAVVLTTGLAVIAS